MKKLFMLLIGMFMFGLALVACDIPEPDCDPTYVYTTNDYYYTNDHYYTNEITNDPPVFEGYDMTFTTYVYANDFTNGSTDYSNYGELVYFKYYTNDTLLKVITNDYSYHYGPNYSGHTNGYNSTLTLLGYCHSIDQGIIVAGEQEKLRITVIVDFYPRWYDHDPYYPTRDYWSATNTFNNEHMYPMEYGIMNFTNEVHITYYE